MNNSTEYFMQRCLQLAKKGINTVAPNPMVGCVVTIPDVNLPFGEKIIGEGYHRKYGGPHAEVNAIESVADKSLLQQATAYVSLEPCSHFGKTPPCADLLISHRLKKVVVAGLDPNELVAGRGVAKLREAGIDVVVNVLQKEAEALNRRFITFHTKKRPYVLLKWAQTRDGFIADHTGKPKWISNPQSRQIVHKLRSTEDAIMVASTTANIDNPKLNNRLWAGKSPVRVLLDSKLQVKHNSHLLGDTEKTIVFNGLKESVEGTKEFVKCDPRQLQEVLHQLYLRKISSVLVEGGSRLLQSFIDQNLWDEACVFESSHLFEQGLAAPHFDHKRHTTEFVSDNLLKHYKNLSN